MQFQIVSLLSVAALASAANITTTYVDQFTTITATITDCEETVTNCPAHKKNGTNVTVPPVTTWEGSANGMYAKAGVVALAGAAAFLL
jgi:hypothetical protein